MLESQIKKWRYNWQDKMPKGWTKANKRIRGGRIYKSGFSKNLNYTLGESKRTSGRNENGDTHIENSVLKLK